MTNTGVEVEAVAVRLQISKGLHKQCLAMHAVPCCTMGALWPP